MNLFLTIIGLVVIISAISVIAILEIRRSCKSEIKAIERAWIDCGCRQQNDISKLENEIKLLIGFDERFTEQEIDNAKRVWWQKFEQEKKFRESQWNLAAANTPNT